MNVNVITIGMSLAKRAVSNNWPIPLTLNTFSVIIAPPNILGTPSAITVTTGSLNFAKHAPSQPHLHAILWHGAVRT